MRIGVIEQGVRETSDCVRWRSDGTYSLQLGQQVAIDLLRAYVRSYAEVAPGATVFEFTRFDGTAATVTA